jgi:hypothetical protein
MSERLLTPQNERHGLLGHEAKMARLAEPFDKDPLAGTASS